MRDLFPGHYRPDAEEFAAIWKDCRFVPDAVVLLNLYRYSESTREQLLSILTEVQDRLWVPYQAALEFQENRLTVIKETRAMYESIRGELRRATNSLKARAKEANRHPVLEPGILQGLVDSFTQEMQGYLDSQPEPFEFDGLTKDLIRDRLTDMLSGRVGPRFSDKDLAGIYDEGAKRYRDLIPPGYRDAEKGGVRQYGDLVIWKETLRMAKAERVPVVFITDDAKDDWWWEFDGKKLGPRPELVMEMQETAGVAFYAYQPDRFMDEASRFLDQRIPKEAIEEVSTIASGRLTEEAPDSSFRDMTFTSTEAREVAGITYRQLDYWVRTGLVSASVAFGLGSGTHRVFSYEDVLRLKMITYLNDSGLSLQAIRKYEGFLDADALMFGGYLVIGEDFIAQVDEEDVEIVLDNLKQAVQVVPLRQLIMDLDRSIRVFRRKNPS